MPMDEVNIEWIYTSITPYYFPDTNCGQATETGGPGWFLRAELVFLYHKM